MIDCSVTIDLQKEPFIKPADIYPHLLKKYFKKLIKAIQKTFFLTLYVVKHFFRFYFKYGSN